MKKVLLFTIVLFSTTISYAQQAEKLSIFRFQPFSLITGSLNFGGEFFNERQTRSTVVGIGIRYVNKEYDANYDYLNQTPYTQLNKWQGGTISIERRFYVPGFYTGEHYKFLNENARLGIYFAPQVKGEFNNNKYDFSSYYQVYKPETPNDYTTAFYENSGKINYLSIMPSMNIGLQFTLFQNLYIDTSIGGGIRILSKKVIESKLSTGTGSYSNYYNVDTPAIDQFIIKEGVQPNFSFALGLNL